MKRVQWIPVKISQRATFFLEKRGLNVPYLWFLLCNHSYLAQQREYVDKYLWTEYVRVRAWFLFQS